jgi:hypothetical protein
VGNGDPIGRVGHKDGPDAVLVLLHLMRVSIPAICRLESARTHECEWKVQYYYYYNY